mmetsp:Transcript_20890/g.30707  ORF Transcript_20890/g.30707 Transcript_20890/m.30707 type:complete len:593 (-) Transcript_20890:2233-4011(-)
MVSCTRTIMERRKLPCKLRLHGEGGGGGLKESEILREELKDIIQHLVSGNEGGLGGGGGNSSGLIFNGKRNSSYRNDNLFASKRQIGGGKRCWDLTSPVGRGGRRGSVSSMSSSLSPQTKALRVPKSHGNNNSTNKNNNNNNSALNDTNATVTDPSSSSSLNDVVTTCAKNSNDPRYCQDIKYYNTSISCKSNNHEQQQPQQQIMEEMKTIDEMMMSKKETRKVSTKSSSETIKENCTLVQENDDCGVNGTVSRNDDEEGCCSVTYEEKEKECKTIPLSSLSLHPAEEYIQSSTSTALPSLYQKQMQAQQRPDAQQPRHDQFKSLSFPTKHQDSNKKKGKKKKRDEHSPQKVKKSYKIRPKTTGQLEEEIETERTATTKTKRKNKLNQNETRSVFTDANGIMESAGGHHDLMFPRKRQRWFLLKSLPEQRRRQQQLQQQYQYQYQQYQHEQNREKMQEEEIQKMHKKEIQNGEARQWDESLTSQSTAMFSEGKKRDAGDKAPDSTHNDANENDMNFNSDELWGETDRCPLPYIVVLTKSPQPKSDIVITKNNNKEYTRNKTKRRVCTGRAVQKREKYKEETNTRKRHGRTWL